MGKKLDSNQAAFFLVEMLSGKSQPDNAQTKNPAAVELGRLGGKARAKALSRAKRKLSAENAAAARWAKKDA